MHRFFEIFRSERKQKSLVIYALSLTTFLVWAAFFAFPGRKLRIWFLDVGQGDAVLFRTPERSTVLIDGGPSEDVATHLGRILPFWEKSLDLLVISHWDADHITGLAAVLETYEVSAIVYPFFDCESMICQKVKGLVDEEEAKKLEVTFGDRFEIGSTVLDIYWPPADCNLGSNDCSIVALLDVGEFEAFFTGDSEERGQLGILGRMSLPVVEVLKVPHHGADCINNAFLEKLSPAVAVVSVGRNSYGHPTEQTLEKLRAAGSRVFRTDRDGTVEIVSDGEGWWIENRK